MELVLVSLKVCGLGGDCLVLFIRRDYKLLFYVLYFVKIISDGFGFFK